MTNSLLRHKKTHLLMESCLVRAPRKIQIFVGVATGFQWFQSFQVRNMAINRGAHGKILSVDVDKI